VFTRTLARVHEAPRLYEFINQWLSVKLTSTANSTSNRKNATAWALGPLKQPAGSLAHWIEIKDGVIKNYQVMAPTTWNVGPNDEQGKSGPIEAALTGIEIEDPHDPVEVGYGCAFVSTPASFAPYTHTMARPANSWRSSNSSFCLLRCFMILGQRPQFLLKIVGVFYALNLQHS
jgi:hypothetical protein